MTCDCEFVDLWSRGVRLYAFRSFLFIHKMSIIFILNMSKKKICNINSKILKKYYFSFDM